MTLFGLLVIPSHSALFSIVGLPVGVIFVTRHPRLSGFMHINEAKTSWGRTSPWMQRRTDNFNDQT